MKLKLVSRAALILMEGQNNFLPGGNLAVADSGQVIPILNRYIEYPLSPYFSIFTDMARAGAITVRLKGFVR